MNKLLVPDGGMPLYGDDFVFMQNAYAQAFSGVIREILDQVGGNLILGGCELTDNGSNWQISEGFVALNYEIMYLPAMTVAKTGGSCEIVPDVFFDPAGLKSFANSSSQNTYQIRRARLAADVSDAYIVMPGGKKLSDSIYDSVASKVVSSTTILTYNSWTKASAPADPILFKQFRRVSLQGSFLVGTINGSSFTQFARLPVGFRPQKAFKAIAAAFGIGVYGSVMVEIFPDGFCFAVGIDANSYDILSLNLQFTSL